MAINVRYSPVSATLQAASNVGRGQANVQRFKMEQQLVQQGRQNQQFQDQLAAQQYNQAQNRQQQMRLAQMRNQLNYAKMAQQRQLQQNQRRNTPLSQALKDALQRHQQQLQTGTTQQQPDTGGVGVIGAVNENQAGNKPVTALSGSTLLSGSNLSNAEKAAKMTHHPDIVQALQGYGQGEQQGGGVTQMQTPQTLDPLTSSKLAYATAMNVKGLTQAQQNAVKALITDPSVNLTRFSSAIKDVAKSTGKTGVQGLSPSQRAQMQVYNYEHQINNAQKKLDQLAQQFTPQEQQMSIEQFRQSQAPQRNTQIDNSWWPDNLGQGGMTAEAHNKQLDQSLATFKQYKHLQQQIHRLGQHRDALLQGAPAETAQQPQPTQHSQAYHMPSGRTVSLSDIQQTAQKHGQTVDQVIQDLHLTPVQQHG